MHVVVESPAKARTLGSWLGIDYTVIASYGHVSEREAAPESSMFRAARPMNAPPCSWRRRRDRGGEGALSRPRRTLW